MPRAHHILAIEPDGVNYPTRIITCLRKLKRKKLVCVAQKPTTASARTWVGAKELVLRKTSRLQNHVLKIAYLFRNCLLVGTNDIVPQGSTSVHDFL